MPVVSSRTEKCHGWDTNTVSSRVSLPSNVLLQYLEKSVVINLTFFSIIIYQGFCLDWKTTHSSHVPSELTHHRVPTLQWAGELNITSKNKCGTEPTLRSDESPSLHQLQVWDRNRGILQQQPEAKPPDAYLDYLELCLSAFERTEAEDRRNKKDRQEETACSSQPDFSLLSSVLNQNKMWHEYDKRLFPFHKVPAEKQHRKSCLFFQPPHSHTNSSPFRHPKPDNNCHELLWIKKELFKIQIRWHSY